MGLFYKIYCPVCHWLFSPDAWKRLDLRLNDNEDIPLGLIQKGDGRKFYRGNNLVKPSDIPASFPVVKGRLIAAFKLWVAKLWIDEDDLKAMGDWIRLRIRVVAGIPLARRITFIEAKRGESKYKEL